MYILATGTRLIEQAMINFSGGHNHWWSAHIELLNNKVSLFDIKFNHSTIKSITFQDACDHAAKLLDKKYNKLYLAMSGGLDSSFVAEVLYRNNISFTPIIARILSTDDNPNYDYFYAMHWCEQHNIQPMVISYEVDDQRLITQTIKLFKKINHFTNGIVILDLLEQVEKLNGNLIVGDPVLPKGTTGTEYHNPIGSDFDTDWYAYLVEIFGKKDTHPGGFFFYTPEILHGVADEIDISLNESAAKTKLYNIPYRPKTWPVPAISQATLDKLCHLYSVTNEFGICNKIWNKKELIDQLIKPSGL